MKRALSVVAGTALAAGLAGTVLMAAPSLAGNSTKTIHFVAVQIASRSIDKTHFIGADKDMHNGVVLGLDTTRCVVTTPGKTATCDVAASYKGGILYGTFTQQFKTGALTGQVTGGTGIFKGATGSITGSAVAQNKEKVTITYHT